MRAGRSGLPRRRRSAWAQRAARLNAWFVARWRLPPLMVTLGSLSLFRGLAEGLTGGVDNYTSLPAALPRPRAGLCRRPMPMQGPVLVAAAIGDMATRAPHRRAAACYFAIGQQRAGGALCGRRRVAAGGGALYPLGTRCRARSYHLRRSPRAGEGRCGHGLRADGGHGRRARRDGDQRRRGKRRGARCSGWRRWSCCRTGCGSPRCRPSSRAMLTGGLLVVAIGLPAVRRAAHGPPGGGGTRGRDAQLSACSALRRDPGGRADRRRQQLVAGALAPSRHGPSSVAGGRRDIRQRDGC